LQALFEKKIGLVVLFKEKQRVIDLKSRPAGLAKVCGVAQRPFFAQESNTFRPCRAFKKLPFRSLRVECRRWQKAMPTRN
jgi:hypothetical protein